MVWYPESKKRQALGNPMKKDCTYPEASVINCPVFAVDRHGLASAQLYALSTDLTFVFKCFAVKDAASRRGLTASILTFSTTSRS